ncbi:MAG TPA: MlaD family protein, partial [Elusimicrobiota bacterium]|nr:MlaD family protein [Elusimicrobiota bacterium]
MTEGPKDSPPRPSMRKRGLSRFLVWLIPLAAATAAAYYARAAYEQQGPLIAIEFPDASGLRVGDTPVRHRGVEIGRVVAVELSPDKSRARVEVRLERGQEEFASVGAAFWLVGPEISGTGLSGVSTLFSGPYIDSRPGRGKPDAEFAASDGSPVEEEGLRLVLRAPRLLGLQPG